MKKQSIVFLAVNSSYSHTNLAALYLRAFTGDMGWDWTTVELVANEDIHKAVDKIDAIRPDVLAATFYLFNRNSVLSVLRRYKALHPKCVILAGGPEFLGNNREFLTCEPCIDGAVRGEGEVAFRLLLESINQPSRWRNIPGFCGMAGGRYVDSGTAAEVADLDSIPSPFELLAWSGSKPFLQLETSRGCRNRCAFCTSGASGAVRHFSIGRVRSDLELIRKAGVRSVRIVDRTFNENRSRCVELLRMFREEFGDMSFHLEVDPALLGPEILRAMGGTECGTWNMERGTRKKGIRRSRAEVAESDCRTWTAQNDMPAPDSPAAGLAKAHVHPTLHLDVGVQSFGATVLKTAGRRGSVKGTIQGLKALCSLGGVAVHADLIAGLPGATIQQTFYDLNRLVSMRPAEIQLELLKLLPGTRLSNERKRFGVVAAPEPPYEVLKTRDMSPIEIHKARLLCKLVDWFYEPESLRETIWAANAELPLFWQQLAEFCSPKPGPWAAHSLETRFRLLDEFLAGTWAAQDHNKGTGTMSGEQRVTAALRQRLRYAWLRHGLSPSSDFCNARPWKEPVPADAKFIEGDRNAEVCRMFSADLGETYIFAYGRKDVDRKAVAVWVTAAKKDQLQTSTNIHPG